MNTAVSLRTLSFTVLAALAFTATDARAAKAVAEINTGTDFSAFGGGATSSFFAHSNMTAPLARGPNQIALFTTEINKGTENNVPVAPGTVIQFSRGILGLGTPATYGPVVSKGGVTKPNNTNGIYSQELVSLRLDVSARAFLFPTKDGKGQMSASGNIIKNNPPSVGTAAAAIYDPYPIQVTIDNAVKVAAEIQSDAIGDTAGADYYATDSFITSHVSDFVETQTPFSATLWHLGLWATRPILTAADLNIDFTLNPDALLEINYPSSYLFSLPGYSPGLTRDAIGALISARVEADLALAFGVAPDGTATLAEFPLFPAGTTFTPMGGSVTFGQGVNASVTTVPEPSTFFAAATALALIVSRYHLTSRDTINWV